MQDEESKNNKSRLDSESTDSEEFELVRLLKSVKCKILEEGYKKVEMVYYFCKCDPDQKDPICVECSKVCHVGEGHAIAGESVGKQICHCGERNHVVDTKKKKADKLYNPKCFFHEWSSVANLNVHYETENGKKICMYCRNFCDYDQTTLTKKKEKKVPACECESHVNIKDIFVNINKVASNYHAYDFENLTLIQFANLLFLSKKSFENLYKPFVTYLEKFREEVMMDNFTFDPNIGFSVFSWANSNFSFFVFYTKSFYYFSETIKEFFSYDYVFRCLEAKADTNSAWVIKNNIFSNFRILTFLGDFSFTPFLKINDIQNLHPLQRLLLASNVKDNAKVMSTYVNNLNFNFLNRVIDLIEKINNIKEKDSENPFEIMKKLFSLCKVFGKFNLFTTDQMIRFCEINDQVIHKFSETRRFMNKADTEGLVNQIKMETNILLPMMKCLIFLIYYYNDSLVESYLNGERDIENLNFYHTNSELAQLLVRNVINVANFIRLYFDMVNRTKDSESILNMKKILQLCVHMTSISTNNPDNYLLGFRRLFNKNSKIYLNYLKGNYTPQEAEFVSFIQVKTEELESLYQKFFELKISEKELKKSVLGSISSVFETVDNEYKPPKNVYSKELYREIKVGLEKAIMSKDTLMPGKTLAAKKTVSQKTIVFYPKVEEEQPTGIAYKTLLNKSFYVFSLVKAIKILSLVKKSSEKENYRKSNKNIDDEIVNEVIKFLFYMVEKDSDNCMFLLNSDIIYSYSSVNVLQGEKFIDLYYYCLSIIRAKSMQLSSFKNVIRFLKSVFKDLENKPDLANIMEKALKLLKVFIDITVENENHMFSIIKKMLKNLFRGNQVFSNIKDLLMNKIKLDNGEELSWKKQRNVIEEWEEEEATVLEEKKTTTVKGKKKTQARKSGKSPNNHKTLKDYDINSILNAYVKYLGLVNYAFDGSASVDETEFLSQILTAEEIITILSSKLDLDLSLRIEILKFYRMAYIDLSLDKERIVEYYSAFVNPVNADGEGIYINDIDYYKFLNDIIRIKNGSDSIEFEYKLLKFELVNLKEIIKDEPTKKIVEYMENGLIMPLNIFFNKFMSLIFNHNGYDFVKFYEIVYYFLEFKKYLVKNKVLYNSKMMKKSKGFFDNGLKTGKKKTILISDEFLNSNSDEIEEDIKEMTKEGFEVLNYKVVHGYLEKHFKGFLIKQKSKSLKDFFSKKKLLYNEEKIQKLHNKLKSLGMLSDDYEKKVLEMLVYYENEKLNFGKSSFIKNLEEVNIVYDTKNRNLLMLFLLFLYNQNFLSDRYKRFNFYTILKILQYDTVYVQQEIYKIYSKNSSTLALHNLVHEFVLCFNSLILSTCNPGNSPINEDYVLSVNILKIMKYLCEEHNRHFQKIFMRKLTFSYDTPEGSPSIITLFNLLLVIVNKIILLSKWDKVRFEAEDNDFSYYYDLFFAIVEFLIEMVQGTEAENFLILLIKTKEEEQTTFISFLNNIKPILLKDKNDSKIIYNVKIDLINFLMAFLEEKETPEKVISIIGRVFNPYGIFDSLVNTMKKLYLKQTNGDVKEYKKFEFDKKMFDFFEDKFFNDKEFLETKEFVLANRLYQYVRLLAEEYKDEDALGILNLKNKNQYTEICRFFDIITKTVYIYKDKKNYRVLFTINPLTAFLSANTKIDFLNNVNRETRYTKLFGLIENCEYFFDEILYNHESKNWLKKILNEFKYYYFEMFLFIMVFIANVYMFVHLERDDVTGVPTYSWNYVYIEIAAAVLSFLVIISWFYTKFQLYCLIELKKYALREKIDIKKVPLFQRLWVYIWDAFIYKNEITFIFINMVLAILGSYDVSTDFVYTFQLFTLINLSITLKNIVRTITLRWEQIVAIIIFTGITVYIFAFAGFNFLNSNGEWNQIDNQCETLFYCFLTNLDRGMRTDGGIGEYLPRYTFQIEAKRYMKIFIFVELYFVVVIVVMIAVLLGVIIDTFVELRENSDKQSYNKENTCFICGANRDELGKDNINYEFHVQNDHLVWNYAFYMIGLKFEDPQELNAINSYAYEAIEKKAISWIPPYDGLTLKTEEGSEGEEEHE